MENRLPSNYFTRDDLRDDVNTAITPYVTVTFFFILALVCLNQKYLELKSVNCQIFDHLDSQVLEANLIRVVLIFFVPGPVQS